MKKMGVCCLFCWKRDSEKATFQMLLIIMIAAFIVGNWLIWTHVAMFPKLDSGIPIVAFIFKVASFIIQIFTFFPSLMTLKQNHKNFWANRDKLHSFGKITFYMKTTQLTFLVGLLCLTSIGINKGATDPRGIKSLGLMFLIGRIVLTGCFIMEFWTLTMAFKIMKFYAEPITGEGEVASRIQMAQSSEKHSFRKSNSQSEFNKEIPLEHKQKKRTSKGSDVEKDIEDKVEMFGTRQDNKIEEEEFNKVEVSPSIIN